MTERVTSEILGIDSKDLDDFKRLQMRDSPFAKRQNKDIFLAAMVIGFKEGAKIPLRNKKGYFRKSYLNPQDKALINSIAVAEAKNLNILLDEKKVFSIAEEYATGGIKFLKDLVFGVKDFGSYSKKLESDMLRAYEKIKKMQPQVDESPEELFDLSLDALITMDENVNVEFKSSLFWDYEKRQKNKLMGIIVAKSISSFMNSRGGILLIGVDDDKNVLGIEKDLKTLEHSSTDQFEIYFTSIIIRYLGKIPRRYIDIKFDEIEGKCVAKIKIKRSPRPVYLNEKSEKKFYVRQGNCSQPLDVEDAPIYIRDNWPDL